MIASVLKLRTFLLIACCGLLFIACDDDDAGTGPSGSDMPDLGGNSPLSGLDQNWYYVCWSLDARSVIGLPPDNLFTAKVRNVLGITRNVGAEADGLQINGLDLSVVPSGSTEFTSFGTPIWSEGLEEFEAMAVGPNKSHTFSSDGTGDFPEFSVDVPTFEEFAVLEPVVSSKVSVNQPLTIRWEGSINGDNEYYIVRAYDQLGTDHYYLVTDDVQSFTISASDMSKFHRGVALQAQVNKYRFVERVFEGKTYYFGVTSTSQNAVELF